MLEETTSFYTTICRAFAGSATTTVIVSMTTAFVTDNISQTMKEQFPREGSSNYEVVKEKEKAFWPAH